MITPRSDGNPLFFREARRSNLAIFRVVHVLIADALTVNFFTTFEHQAPWGFEIFDFPPGSKYCIVIPS
jgi:hypothetical protein